jgi:CRISPR/Cas system-associated exonuclease Cas4 (RecB family)
MNRMTIVHRARKTGEFVPNLATTFNRLSKSKLNGFIDCPRMYWYFNVLKRVVPDTPQSKRNFYRGRVVHKIDETFYRYCNANRDLLYKDGESFISGYFDRIELDPQFDIYIKNIHEWQLNSWKTYWDSGYEDTILKYFIPLTLKTGELGVERKVYNEKMDWVTICDSIFWVPPEKKGHNKSDYIMIVDDKSGKHKEYKYTSLRVELTFMKRVMDASGLLPDVYTKDGYKPGFVTSGAIYYPLSNDVMLTKITQTQEKALNRRLERLKFSYDNDFWPCRPAVDWICNYCSHSDVCPHDYQTKEYDFPPGLELDDE